ncbi:hypothetical protein BFU36_06435 [Sulfolobus sp. A20]|uniref:zinc ribbon domain-containing protein n=1 Tax=Sulfolobaceae TaxID=118883 RepID=UPI000845FF1D|nr:MULTISPECIES: zinc ribbon domain-containing protein [unclassified Sulfolobus]TRM74566.1 zinc ribbon domain-containing protein [Sulfolobus sp. E5]TRM77149.1 zinc ribbon domain-containing protein [Sulfolobus sp. B5]TRM80087.1 zinc ribbon domain-containing protein [Sulfolobus sp. D5]TRM84307.1 zinc ribbon domain-containing protein [Sulfolobus sp. A20-N-F6]TRM89610.1 zinc ribbon domain-containing protein [Sulfolobus sp. C3]TRM95256.1 zinc ribbon domain-containing protein [Sulfolobus sp. A20-N-
MSNPYYGQPNWQPYGGYQQNPMMSMMACNQPIGLGGQQQIIPVNYPINLQYVVQQVQMFLMGQGFQVFPMVAQNMAVIQAQHSSILGTLTDQNKAYTIRICQGPGFVMVETGIANLLQELLVAGATFGVTDELLHNKLAELAGAGIDAYGIYKEYAQEQQLMNMIMMIVSNAPPAYQQQPYYPNQQPYGPQPYYPGQQYQPYQPPMQQPPPQQSISQQQSSPQQTAQAKQSRQTIKCWNCGHENEDIAKFCANCGASLLPIKCPSCGHINSPSAKFCENCGYNLRQSLGQQSSQQSTKQQK